jgi:hypothetical protein
VFGSASHTAGNTATGPRARCLQDLAREVRGKTLLLLDAAGPDELTWVPPGTSNHLLWHAGHAAWLGGALCLRLVTGRSELPAGWDERFGMGSHPADWASAWPTKEDVLHHLRAQRDRLVAVIGSVKDEDLDRRPPFAHRGDGRRLGACILHGLHDEANHQGEMYLLLKMHRRATGQR